MGVLGDNESSRERTTAVFAMIFFKTQADDCEALRSLSSNQQLAALERGDLSLLNGKIDTPVRCCHAVRTQRQRKV
jgi:hypothetical protein